MTPHLPDGEQMSIYDASMKYQKDGVPLMIIAGKEYGSGSSRDWAAKGVLLLGVRAVIAESFERIHRTNLVGMGVLPLQFQPGETRDDARAHRDRNVLTSRRPAVAGRLGRRAARCARWRRTDGEDLRPSRCAWTLRSEVEYFRNGGILPYVLRQLANSAAR